MEGGATTSASGMDIKKNRSEKFLIPLVPEELVGVNLKLPGAMVKNLGHTIPQTIYFYIPNGDKFECRYSHVGQSFFGAIKVLRQYNAKTYGLLTFEYVNGTDFFVNIFDTSGVEIEYPGSGRFFPYEPESKSFLTYRTAEEGVMVDSINANTLDNCCKKGWEQKIYILITNARVEVKETDQVLLDHNRDPISYWFDGCGIYLSTRHRAWTVYVRKVDKIRVFREGWKDFVGESGVENGDLLIMERDGNPFHFQIGVCKGYDILGKSLVAGTYKPMKFVRFVNEAMVSTGETFIPIPFWHKYGNVLEETVFIAGACGKIFRIKYCRAAKKLYGMQQMLTEYKLRNPYIIVFRFDDPRTLTFEIFGKNRVECHSN